MGKATGNSIAKFIMQIALGAMLVVAGIWAVMGGGDFAAAAIKSLLSKDLGKILAMIFGIVEIVVGALLILELFIGDKFGKFDNILMWIVIIVWIAAIILGDFISKSTGIDSISQNLWGWIYNLASHLLVLGTMLYLKD